jgi:hypothetical protein
MSVDLFETELSLSSRVLVSIAVQCISLSYFKLVWSSVKDLFISIYKEKDPRTDKVF